jgi:hypothetical protein
VADQRIEKPHPNVRKLFPADDLVAQWVFALTATAQDLAAAERAFRDALDEGVAFRSNYLYRQLVARIYEAERVVIAIEQHEAVGVFLAGLPESESHVAVLREAYLPHDESRVRAVYGEMRHRTVHHSPVGSEELRDALREAGEEEVRLLVDYDEKQAFYEWPEAVASRVLVGDISKPEVREAYKDAMRFAQQLAGAFARLVGIALPRHCERRGVDMRALACDLKDA